MRFDTAPSEFLNITLKSGFTGEVSFFGSTSTYKDYKVTILSGFSLGELMLLISVNGNQISIGLITCEGLITTNLKVLGFENEFQDGSNTLYVPLNTTLSKTMLVSTQYTSGLYTFQASVDIFGLEDTNNYLGGGISPVTNYNSIDPIDTLTSSFTGINWNRFSATKINYNGKYYIVPFQPVQGLPSSTLYITQFPIKYGYLSYNYIETSYLQYNSSVATTIHLDNLAKPFYPNISLINPTTTTFQLDSQVPFKVLVGTLPYKNYIQGTKGVLSTLYNREFPLYPYGMISGSCSSYMFGVTFLLPYYSNTMLKYSLRIDQFSIDYIYSALTLDNVAPILNSIKYSEALYPLYYISINASDALSGISRIDIGEISMTSKHLTSGTIFNGLFESTFYPHQLNYTSQYTITIFDNAQNFYKLDYDYYFGMQIEYIQTPILRKISSPYSITSLNWDKPELAKPGIKRTLSITLSSFSRTSPQLKVNIPNYESTFIYMTFNQSTGLYKADYYLPYGLYTQNIDYQLIVHPYTFGVSSLYSLFGESALLSVTNSNPLGADQFPPVIVSYTPSGSPITLTSGLNNVSVEITIQDGINGFESGNITFSSDLDPQGFSFKFDSSTMVSSGVYRFKMPMNVVSNYCSPQVYDIKSIFLSDKMGYISQHPAPDMNYLNPWYIMNSKGFKSQFSVLCPTGSIPDPNPPKLKNLVMTLPSTNINICGFESERTITLEVTVGDSESGILEKNSPYIYFEGLNDIIGYQSVFLATDINGDKTFLLQC
ncbi:hypothetical protein DLAC_09081 [Tieghemostelium lacteum]|uniref:Uncharacterized protein n=1 Tax=Tieghemostelium lacteum TaxID=361077 RepID=A0A151Z934_TIELA|nr:hypothetical protein DLAC_09081 [Tieghemostelium lacteum]|eukprot:KYQ90458.1 hypothetical protein DLAC_09081 [Tieghemostelium lacteum]